MTTVERLMLRRASKGPITPAGQQWRTARLLIEAGYLLAQDGAVQITDAGRQAMDLDKLVSDNGY